MKIREYDRSETVKYAKKYAKVRNPKYYNFDNLGGDCTNFVSQCIFAGTKTMNYTPLTGWYYSDINDRTPSWSGVEYLYNFLVNNKGIGPFGQLTDREEIEVGDIIELGRATGEFYHSVIVSGVYNGNILVCSHTYDALDKWLDSYIYERIRYIKIMGTRIN